MAEFPSGATRVVGDEEGANFPHGASRAGSRARPPSDILSGVNVGIAEAVGSPVDLVAFGLRQLGLSIDRPFLGGEHIQWLMSEAGMTVQPGQEPSTIPFQAGRVAGQAATLALPVVGAGARLAVAGRPTTTIAGGITRDIGELALRRPGRFAAAELGLGATAGAGGEIAAREFGEEARLAGEVVGGLTPAGLAGGGMRAARGVGGAGLAAIQKAPIIGPVAVPVIRSLRGQFARGALGRAEQRIERAAAEPGAIRQAAREPEAFQFADETLLPEAVVLMTPAQRLGDEGLLSLESAVMQSSAQLKGARGEQVAKVTDAIRRATKEIAAGVPPGKLGESEEAAQGYLVSLLDARARIAIQRAEERVAELGGGATREQINVAAREELSAVEFTARVQERELWAAIPKVKLSAEISRAEYAAILRETPKAQRGDIPEIAGRFLWKKGLFKKPQPLSELQGLRSKLLEEARIARAAGRRNEARLADRLADALLGDMGAAEGAVAGDAGEAVRIAIDFSRNLNDILTRGPLARILGFERVGGRSVAAGMTLEASVGRGGPAGREAVDALLRASREFGNEATARDAVTSFLKTLFLRQAVRDGKVNAAGARAFFRKYDEVLTRFPELHTNLDQTFRLGTAVPPTQAIRDVLRSPNAGRAMRELLAEAGKPGAAVDRQGVKAGLIDHIVTGGKPELLDEQLIPGDTMLQRMRNPRVAAALRVALTGGERQRLAQVAQTAQVIQRALSAKPDAEGIIKTAPNALVEIVARIAGAQAGRVVARETGGGTVQTPGILSERVKRGLTSSVQDPAQRLIVDAIQNEELFSALVTRTAIIATRSKTAKRLNAWAADIIRQAGEGIEEREIPEL